MPPGFLARCLEWTRLSRKFLSTPFAKHLSTEIEIESEIESGKGIAIDVDIGIDTNFLENKMRLAICTASNG